MLHKKIQCLLQIVLHQFKEVLKSNTVLRIKLYLLFDFQKIKNEDILQKATNT